MTELRKSVPPNVAAAVAKSLEKLPADRFASREGVRGGAEEPRLHDGGRHRRHGRGRAGGLRALAPDRDGGLGAGCRRDGGGHLGARAGPSPPGPWGAYPVVLDSTAPLAYFGADEPGRLALTPDGRELVYAGDLPGRDRQLFLRPLGSLVSRPIPGTSGAPILPTVSWDGSQVAFIDGHSPPSHDPGRVAAGRAAADAGGLRVPELPGLGTRRVRVLHRRRRHDPARAGGRGTDRGCRGPPRPRQGGASRLARTSSPAARRPGRRGHAGDDGQYKLHVVELKTGRIRAHAAGRAGLLRRRGTRLSCTWPPTAPCWPCPSTWRTSAVRGRPVPLFGNLSVRGNDSDLGHRRRNARLCAPRHQLQRDDRVGGPRRRHDAGGHRLARPRTRGVRAVARRQPARHHIVRPMPGPAGWTSGSSRWTRAPSRGSPSVEMAIRRLPGRRTDGTSATSRAVTAAASLWRRRADGVGSEELVADPGPERARRPLVRRRRVAGGGGRWPALAGHHGHAARQRHGPATAPGRELRRAEAEPVARRALAGVPSRETGDWEIFVRPFPDVDEGKWQISQDGGHRSTWSGDGRELFYPIGHRATASTSPTWPAGPRWPRIASCCARRSAPRSN